MKKFFALFLLMLSFLVTASPATDYSFVRQFGQSGIEVNQFYEMDGIAVDRFGNVFISDKDLYIDIYGTTNVNVTIKKWTVDGSFQTNWIVGEWSSMIEPAGIDCSCDGDPFYVAPASLVTPYGKNIEHSSPIGKFYETFPNSDWARDGFYFIDVAASADGYIYGTFVKNDLKSGGEIPGIVKFVWTGSNWVQDVQIILDPAIIDTSADVHAIDVDPWRERVYVTVLADAAARPAAVKVYDMDLNHIEDLLLWNYDAMPYGIAVDNRNGSFFVCEALSNVVQKFSTSGEPITQWGEYGTGESQFHNPSDIDVDMNGYVYVADANNHRVQVFAPPLDGNLNFIVYKSKVVVKWKLKTKGKNRDVVMAKGFVAVDALTNIFSGPGSSALKDLPVSFWFGELPIINNMQPTKTNKKGTRALYKPDKEHKMVLVYKEKGALIKFVAKLKKGNVDGPLEINDVASLPPWLWVNAQISLSTNYFGLHYLRMEHKNKVGKVYKALKK